MKAPVLRRNASLLLTICCLVLSQRQARAQENGGTVTGAMLFHTHCAACHGESARGDGMVGAALRTPPPDLTLLAHNNGGVFPEGMVWEFIDGTRDVTAHGPRAMPVWGLIFRDQETIRKIVEFLKEHQRS